MSIQNVTVHQGTLQQFASAPHQINEEELAAVAVHVLLSDTSESLAADFSASYERYLANGQSAEDSTKSALRELVSAGALSNDAAEQLHGVAFRAAQLDGNLEALYDSRGSSNDFTVATASLHNALQSVREMIARFTEGKLSIAPRALDAPSNVAPNSSVSARGGFLWKPRSESDGNLVVLLPPQLTGLVESAQLYSALPPTEQNRLEVGRFTGDTHNGGRAHFRFDQPGGSYPDGAVVLATLTDGRTVSFRIGESSSRNER